MELRQPLALLLLGLPLLGLCLWAARGSAVGLSRGRFALSLTLRALLVVALGLVLADLRMVLPHDDRSVVFVIDTSESISPTSRRHMLEWVREAWQTHRPGDRAGLVVFGNEARTLVPLGPTFNPGELSLDGLKRNRTTIHEGLRAAVNLLGGEENERLVVLLSDGNGDSELAVSEAMALASSGISITTVAVEVTPSPREVLLGDVDAPQRVSTGEPFLLQAEVVARSGGRATVHVVRNGEYLEPVTVELAPGSNRISVPQRLETSGSYVYDVSVEARGDGNVANNAGGAIVRVRGRPRVLFAQGPAVDDEGEVVLTGAEVAEPLRRVLDEAGFDVDVRSLGGLPLGLDELAGYDAFIFGGVSADRWTVAQMEAVRQYVFAQGGGLVALGSEQSFGQGGYYRTPIEEAMPVSSDVRGKKILPSMGLVFAIDCSGSMAEQAGNATRLELAREGAARSIDLLHPFDLVGLIAFDNLPRWVIDVAHVDQPGKLKSAIRSLELGGGTAIAPALEEARIGLAAAEAQIKHVVLLTDGRSNESAARFNQITDDYNADGITLTTVGVGQEVDKELLDALAKATGGRFLWAPDARTLPRLLTQEAVTASRALLVERDVVPRHHGQLEALGIDWEAAPPLRGFVMTVAKDDAEVVLDTGPEETVEDGPLLVRWRYGLGKALAFTSDGVGRWTAPWLSWPAYGRLFPELIRWVARAPEAPGIRIELELDEGRGKLTLHAEDPEGRPRNGLALRGNLVGPPAAGALPSLALGQTAPGTYTIAFDCPEPGAYFVTVQEEHAGETRNVGTGGGVLAYPREYRHLTHDQDLLDRLAAVTRGEALTLDHPPTQVFAGERHGRTSFRPLAPYLFALAALLLLVEVAVRRLVLPSGWLVRAAKTSTTDRRESQRLLATLRKVKNRDRKAATSRREQRAEVADVAAPAPPVARPEPTPPPPLKPTPQQKPTPPADDPQAGSMSKLLEAKRKARRKKKDQA